MPLFVANEGSQITALIIFAVWISTKLITSWRINFLLKENVAGISQKNANKSLTELTAVASDLVIMYSLAKSSENLNIVKKTILFVK